MYNTKVRTECYIPLDAMMLQLITPCNDPVLLIYETVMRFYDRCRQAQNAIDMSDEDHLNQLDENQKKTQKNKFLKKPWLSAVFTEKKNAVSINRKSHTIYTFRKNWRKPQFRNTAVRPQKIAVSL